MRRHKIGKKLAILGLGVMIFFFAGSNLMAQISLPQKVFLKAVEDLKAGRYRKAQAGFEQILSKEPDNLKARYYLGLVMYEQQRLPEAVAFFQWVQQRAPQMPIIHYYLGRIDYDNQQWDAALEKMETVHRLDPQFSMACYYLGLIHYKKKEIPEARKEFETALELESALSKAHYALAYLFYHDLKDFPAALLHIDKGIKGKLDRKLHHKFLLLRKKVNHSLQPSQRPLRKFGAQPKIR